MHIITRARLTEFWQKHPNAQTSLRLWYKLTSVAEWQNFVDLSQTFPTADKVGNLTVFNISGNNYRLITFIDYQYQKVFIRYVLTHAEYDKDDWKNDPWNT
ncbi:type II toxin-antitoxin system HigB family toxin [Nostoc spongiaeforme FACHB-130]|uniref:Type II toxin-antitoxin system HigB family toxin n=1 Tax=Nostoc spongiaeforme FACHB-130 TaxID=1357510 RepID=A0ABR8G571_9NOSO|nr:type II toxin-antitoxin system HigB family toxin [Nostoc spongiaeforme]MBD2598326.1 type II toxin-antitoxin system HigB family toxin [Nostoc spongiaeforme FACHB-130]